MRRVLLAAVAIAPICISVLFAQSLSSPRFEVASVKPSAQEDPGSPGQRATFGGVRILPGGRLVAQGTVLRSIIQYAYRLKGYQVLGGPDWIDSARYDIEAKAEGNSSPDQLWLMLQSLLDDRFKLKLHRETKQLTVYELTVAKGGLKLPPPKEGGCAVSDPGMSRLPPKAGQPRPNPCGVVSMSAMAGGAQLNGGQVSISALAFTLSNMLGRTVIDKTGFTSAFDLHMSFTPDASLEGLPLPTGRGGERIALAEDPSNGTLFGAIQQQLGLKLESAKGPVEVIVIDRVEKPIGN